MAKIANGFAFLIFYFPTYVFVVNTRLVKMMILITGREVDTAVKFNASIWVYFLFPKGLLSYIPEGFVVFRIRDDWANLIVPKNDTTQRRAPVLLLD